MSKLKKLALVKNGLFYRIYLPSTKEISVKKFLTMRGAAKYYLAHQDRHGFPVKKLDWRKVK